MTKKIKNTLVLFGVALAILAGSVDGRCESARRKNGVLDVQTRYQDLLLQLSGVDYVTTSTCEKETGKLVFLFAKGPVVPCVAVKVKSSADLKQIETVYPNPLNMNGVLIHFTDQDPRYGKGGITVHN
ncbi:MAG: hypothetical protein A2428_02835 [Bdellovibrionales bacterium RIFOXYC1_FULL_54_43]|nr:MAG: hypothetical protein A2428_02835 [Bdellovibrionales bacterium RIFOXYC1_FULL_54_43]